MVKHYCDICGEEMGVWVSVMSKPDAVLPMANVYELLKYSGEKHYCLSCMGTIQTQIEYARIRAEESKRTYDAGSTRSVSWEEFERNGICKRSDC